MSQKFLITEEEKTQIRKLYGGLLFEQTNNDVKFTVKDEETNQTIPGANVVIYNSDGKPINGGQTDDEGSVIISVPDNGVKFGISFVGFNNYENSLEKSKTNYEISLKPDVGKVLSIEEKNDINIKIIDKNDSPLANVKVTYKNPSGESQVFKTDDSGKFIKSGVQKNSEIQFEKNGYEKEFIDFNGEPIELSITLKPLKIYVVDDDGNKVDNVSFNMGGEQYQLNSKTLKTDKFNYPYTIELIKDGYESKSIKIDGVKSIKVSLKKIKPKEKSWRDKIIEEILSTERTLTFYKKTNNDKKIQVSIDNIKILNDDGLDSVVVFGSFVSYEDKIVLLLNCDEYGYFEILSYPKKYIDDESIIDKKSLSFGKRYGLYANNTFYKLLKTNLKLCGINKI